MSLTTTVWLRLPWRQPPCRVRYAPISRRIPFRVCCLVSLPRMQGERGRGSGQVWSSTRSNVALTRRLWFGGRALMVNTIDEGAARFWLRRGSVPPGMTRSFCSARLRILRRRWQGSDAGLANCLLGRLARSSSAVDETLGPKFSGRISSMWASARCRPAIICWERHRGLFFTVLKTSSFRRAYEVLGPRRPQA